MGLSHRLERIRAAEKEDWRKGFCFQVSSVHFARSDVSTRSFDFEIELKSGATLVFNSVEKLLFTRLFDLSNFD